MRQKWGELRLSFGEELLQGFPYLKVKRRALFSKDRPVGRFLRERMAKGVFALWIASRLKNEFHSLEYAQMTVQVFSCLRNGLQHAVIKATPNYGCQL